MLAGKSIQKPPPKKDTLKLAKALRENLLRRKAKPANKTLKEQTNVTHNE